MASVSQLVNLWYNLNWQRERVAEAVLLLWRGGFETEEQQAREEGRPVRATPAHAEREPGRVRSRSTVDWDAQQNVLPPRCCGEAQESAATRGAGDAMLV